MNVTIKGEELKHAVETFPFKDLNKDDICQIIFWNYVQQVSGFYKKRKNIIRQ